jgi:hypothetical protein
VDFGSGKGFKALVASLKDIASHLLDIDVESEAKGDVESQLEAQEEEDSTYIVMEDTSASISRFSAANKK